MGTIDHNRSGYLHTSDTGQNTCTALTLVRISAHRWHWSMYLFTSDIGQAICTPRRLVRLPAYPWHWSGHLHTPDVGQATCLPRTLVRLPVYPRHWSGYLLTPDTGQGTCTPLMLASKLGIIDTIWLHCSYANCGPKANETRGQQSATTPSWYDQCYTRIASLSQWVVPRLVHHLPPLLLWLES